MAVIDVIEQEGLLARSATLGAYLRRELAAMQDDCEWMGDVRGCGLFVAIDWVSDKAGKTADPDGAFDVANRLKEKGFLLSNAGALHNVVKIRPPLPFQQEQADAFLEAFAEMLREMS